MFTNSKLSKAMRLAVTFGAVSSMLVMGAANAQEEQKAEQIERIEVTGSRILREVAIAPLPVSIG
ncbi:hypothetical protein VT06_03635 [Arsukibacterium sp. MJ3]|uniref:hypothetical protein n=1 Tax=Arsukibacterium sp. MJ3 TaxID=1632859 RepID=UPI0006273A53|nr:hypothetical protein [Arsukibacterium sp. MJ3]KKO50085.1 hypothetical protein VT06_03635 [Arsukibacterium sp. MJ3]